ncbi:MAG: protease modulator HflC, partial [Thiogranum sp.]
RQRQVLIAEAYREAEQTRGMGDARAAEIYAQAFSKDKEFYAFFRSLRAYQESFDGSNDLMLLAPDGEFFEYFNQGGQ